MGYIRHILFYWILLVLRGELTIQAVEIALLNLAERQTQVQKNKYDFFLVMCSKYPNLKLRNVSTELLAVCFTTVS